MTKHRDDEDLTPWHEFDEKDRDSFGALLSCVVLSWAFILAFLVWLAWVLS